MAPTRSSTSTTQVRPGIRAGLLVTLLLLSSVAAAATESEKPTLVEPKIELGIHEYLETAEPRPVDKSVTRLGDREGDNKRGRSTTDHSKLKKLQREFHSGEEVTKACLDCHNKAGEQFMHNKHWTWNYDHPETGQKLGKGTLINNFCTNARGNEGMCAQCHTGYGMDDVTTFDFNDQSKIDCLVCHESTGTYYKTPPTQGNKACSTMFDGKKPIDWTKVAQSVKLPGRNNCGSCHFYGGGGDNVKHGDLSSALFQPDRELDVHMGVDGENFACTVCHTGEGHEWAGSRYQMTVNDTDKPHKPGMPRDTASCASCHGEQPHEDMGLMGMKLNDHTDRVACETCHIPEFARGGVATKTEWDWRTAGKLKDGEGYREEGYIQGNGQHRHTYKSIKGDFKYDENMQPEYHWFNGVMHYTTIDTKFDPSQPVEINRLGGDANDPKAKIWPFKLMKTMQPYDKGNNTLVYMHLWGNDFDAFWGNYDFGRAIEHGMEKNGIPYSGEYDFIETVSYWPINHMVPPKENALRCQACHAKQGRLDKVEGVYLPGRDSNIWVDRLGLLILAATILGILGHGALRLVLGKKSH
ncbi:MAG: tetrathionate reductase family octaheme c-type cytochrome [Gammaproteobacteria bacterium]